MLTGILERTVEEFGLPQRRPGFESQVGLVAALLIYTLVLKKTKKKGKINNKCHLFMLCQGCLENVHHAVRPIKAL